MTSPQRNSNMFQFFIHPELSRLVAEFAITAQLKIVIILVVKVIWSPLQTFTLKKLTNKQTNKQICEALLKDI